MPRGETTRVNPDTGETERGRYMFGKWFKDWKPAPAKGKGKSKSRSREADSGGSGGASADAPPAGLDLPSRPSLAKDIGQAISGYNAILCMLPWTADDALTQGEAERLVYGLDEAQKANATIRKYVKLGTTGAGVGALIIAAGAIVLDRMAKHGWLPGLSKPTPEQYAAMREQQEAAYRQMMAQEAAGAVPPDPYQQPTVPPVYSNGGGPAGYDGPIVYTR